jgi:SAM-dependent methyltransferase
MSKNRPTATEKGSRASHLKREMSWAAYALDGRLNDHYFRSNPYLESFPPGSFVIDVGCGSGWTLEEHLARGGRGAGAEVDERCLVEARAKGLDVVRAPAESLPFETGSADGVIFSGVLPFTEEDQAFAEIARILRPGGRLEAYYIGAGFALRDLLVNRDVRKRYFGLRSLVNSVMMGVAGRKLPGKYGDTAYVTHRRLAELYERHGLILRARTPSPTFLGQPVFIYHSAERSKSASR